MVGKAMVDTYMLMETVCFRLRDCEVAGGGLERDVRQLWCSLGHGHEAHVGGQEGVCGSGQARDV